jgi:hypothetical protein
VISGSVERTDCVAWCGVATERSLAQRSQVGIHRLAGVAILPPLLDHSSTSDFISLSAQLLIMRQRITYLQEPQDSVDPSTLKVTKNSISASDVKAAREEKITFGLKELPEELVRVLEDSHELHVRWVSEAPYEAIAPLVSRLSSGLHVFYTPQRNSNTSYVLSVSR